MIVGRAIEQFKSEVREIRAGSGTVGRTVARRVNSPAINRNNYGERFVKALVLVCLPSGMPPELRHVGIVASVEK